MIEWTGKELCVLVDSTDLRVVDYGASSRLLPMRRPGRHDHAGFTFVELLIVVIIVAILAAVVVPRLVASTDEAKVAALDSNLRRFRSAIALYNQQHGEYPAAHGDGSNAAHTEAAFVAQLTTFTDNEGVSSAAKDATHIYGPYLTRAGMPTDPFRQVATVEIVNDGTLPLTATAGDPGGWKFDTSTGLFIINHTAYDDH